jgi:hypothetical protein
MNSEDERAGRPEEAFCFSFVSSPTKASSFWLRLAMNKKKKTYEKLLAVG